VTWTRLDDKWDDSEKLEMAAEVVGDSAFALWARAVTFCNRNLTDGRISGAKLRSLTKHRKPREVVASLVDVRALDDVGGDIFQVHDFLDWNEPREAVEARRMVKREAASKGGRATALARHEGAKEAAPCWPSGASLERPSPLLSSPSGSSNTEIPPVVPQGDSAASPSTATEAKVSKRSRCPDIDATPEAVEAWLLRWDIPPLSDRTWGPTVANMLSRNQASGGMFINWTAAWNTSAGKAVEWGNASGDPARCRRSRLATPVQCERAPEPPAAPSARLMAFVASQAAQAGEDVATGQPEGLTGLFAGIGRRAS
jgi:hypothetical protein